MGVYSGGICFTGGVIDNPQLLTAEHPSKILSPFYTSNPVVALKCYTKI
jgi:hypothetical protein